jgi:hypothetical protein
MNSILDPFLSILAIFMPLGLAYAMLTSQPRKSGRHPLKLSVTPRCELPLNKVDAYRAEDKSSAV